MWWKIAKDGCRKKKWLVALGITAATLISIFTTTKVVAAVITLALLAYGLIAVGIVGTGYSAYKSGSTVEEELQQKAAKVKEYGKRDLEGQLNRWLEENEEAATAGEETYPAMQRITSEGSKFCIAAESVCLRAKTGINTAGAAAYGLVDDMRKGVGNWLTEEKYEVREQDKETLNTVNEVGAIAGTIPPDKPMVGAMAGAIVEAAKEKATQELIQANPSIPTDENFKDSTMVNAVVVNSITKKDPSRTIVDMVQQMAELLSPDNPDVIQPDDLVKLNRGEEKYVIGQMEVERGDGKVAKEPVIISSDESGENTVTFVGHEDEPQVPVDDEGNPEEDLPEEVVTPPPAPPTTAPHPWGTGWHNTFRFRPDNGDLAYEVVTYLGYVHRTGRIENVEPSNYIAHRGDVSGGYNAGFVVYVSDGKLRYQVLSLDTLLFSGELDIAVSSIMDNFVRFTSMDRFGVTVNWTDDNGKGHYAVIDQWVGLDGRKGDSPADDRPVTKVTPGMVSARGRLLPNLDYLERGAEDLEAYDWVVKSSREEENHLELKFDRAGGDVTGSFTWRFSHNCKKEDGSTMTVTACYAANLTGTYSGGETGSFQGKVTGSVSGSTIYDQTNISTMQGSLDSTWLAEMEADGQISGHFLYTVRYESGPEFETWLNFTASLVD